MGALTFKPFAYGGRPWETTPVGRTDYEGTPVVHHTRGTRVVRVTGAAGTPWLSDAARFAHDGYRRQRLVTPHRGTTPVGWPAGLATLVGYLVGGRAWSVRVDPTGTVPGWWARLYAAGGDPRGRPATAVVDSSPARTDVYHGAFGLAGTPTAGVALPGGLPHEGGPAGAVALVQALGSPRRATRAYPPPADLPRRGGPPPGGGYALLQVSPLQRVLAGW